MTISMDKEHLSGLMEDNILVNILWIKDMDTVNLYLKMDLNMKDRGKIMFSMEKV